MIETFSDLAKLLDDGWRITGIRADSDGERQTLRFEVGLVKRGKEPWRDPAWILECGCDNFIEHCEQCDARRAMKRNAITSDLTDFTFMPQGPREEPLEDAALFRKRLKPAITPEGWEIGSGFAEFLHSVGHGNLDTEDAR